MNGMLRAVFIAVFGLVVAAPALRADDAATKDQVTAAYSGNTHYYKTSTYEFAGYYDPSGVSHGKTWWIGGSEQSDGKWHVTDDGLICLQWDNPKWDGGGQESCFKVTISGDSLKTEHVSGANAPSRNPKIIKGHSYGV